MAKIDLNHIAWNLLALSIALDQPKVNGKLRFGGFKSPQAVAECREWLKEVEDQDDIPGISTHDRMLLAVVCKICRPDLADSYSQFIETCRIDRFEDERREAEEERGRQRLEAAKAERLQAKAQRDAKKQAEVEAAQLAAANESLRRLRAEPEDWRRRYPRPDPWAHVKVVRELP